jgi:hypothetical protein
MRDAYITEVMVTLKGTYADRLAEAVKQLQGAGLHVDHADDDNSMVEGSIDAGKASALEKLDCVQYVRKMHTYAAEFPKGDPRDVNHDANVSPDCVDRECPPRGRRWKNYP